LAYRFHSHCCGQSGLKNNFKLGQAVGKFDGPPFWPETQPTLALTVNCQQRRQRKCNAVL